jgi:NMDA receptor-regulated protein 1
METDADGLEHVKKLLNVAEAELTPLGEATKRIRLLEQFSSQNVMTFVLGFEIAMRKRKVLQALRAVHRALALDAEHPSSIFIAVRLRHALEFGELRGARTAAVRAVLDAKGQIPSAKGVVEFVEDYAARNLKHIHRRLGAGEIMLWLAQADCPGAKSSLDAVDFIIAALQDASPYGHSDMSISVSFSAEFLQRLSSGAFRLDQIIIDKIALQLRQKYPRCILFEQGAYGCMRVT